MPEDPATTAIHGDGDVASGPEVAPPISVSTTFQRSNDGPTYRRYDHATTERLEAVLGSLEGGHAVAYASGMAAIAAVLRLLGPQRIALPDDLYGGTRSFVYSCAERGEWTVGDDVATGDVLWVESPSNPRCRITDIAAAVAATEATVVVDATFATPLLQRTLELGTSFVVHSTTKFINGHSDAIGGVIVTSDGGAAADLRRRRDLEGPVMGALESWLTLRGVRTLPLRVARQAETAEAVAAFLAGRVSQVWHPSLPSHPDHAVWQRQMSGGPGVLAFEMASADEARAVRNRLRLFTAATSLGGVESTVDHRLDHDDTAPPGLLRLSLGLEAVTDLIADLEHALTS